ncbi:hypothetical protein HXX76_012087 [Chlamydomonas incerta]|uniref:Pherophorin domain-containing protein n=1 Tax=Chlamydomonas incerta TaxID=51695 RepID=A0A835SIG1_CHLIN|nr:hypothetical protein HXX76_012087 [Chlamydomonas incerta]|eukprot:KAG2427762.1 hypothetical protein HXX76_012087 [Chlamydomonas incerta]
MKCHVSALLLLGLAFGLAFGLAELDAGIPIEGTLEELPLVVDLSPCVSFQADDAAPLISLRDGAVLGYVTVRSGAEPGAPRRPDGSTLLRLDVSLLGPGGAGAGGGGGGAAAAAGGRSGVYLAQPRVLAHDGAHGQSSVSQANIVAALSRRMPDDCPSTVPASRVAAAVNCSVAAGGSGAGSASASAALLVSVPTALFRCGPGEQEEQFRSFFLQLAVDVSTQACGPATGTAYAGTLQNSITPGCSYILVTATCKPATCPPANGTGGGSASAVEHTDGTGALPGAALPSAIAAATSLAATATASNIFTDAPDDLLQPPVGPKPAMPAAAAAHTAATATAAAEPMLPLHGQGPALEHDDIDVVAARRRVEEQQAAARSGGLVGGAALSLALCVAMFSARWRWQRRSGSSSSGGAASAAAAAAAAATVAAATAAAAASTARAQLLQQRALSSRRRHSQCGNGAGSAGGRSPFQHMHLDGLDSDQASVASGGGGCGSPAGWGGPPLPPSRRASQSGSGSPVPPPALGGAAASGSSSVGGGFGMSASARRRLTHDGAVSCWPDAALVARGSVDMSAGLSPFANAAAARGVGSPAEGVNPSAPQSLVPPPPRPPLHRFVSVGSKAMSASVASGLRADTAQVSGSAGMPGCTRQRWPQQLVAGASGAGSEGTGGGGSSRGGSPAIVLDSDDSDYGDDAAPGAFHSVGGGPGRAPVVCTGALTIASTSVAGIHACSSLPLPPLAATRRGASQYGGSGPYGGRMDVWPRGAPSSAASSPGWSGSTPATGAVRLPPPPQHVGSPATAPVDLLPHSRFYQGAAGQQWAHSRARSSCGGGGGSAAAGMGSLGSPPLSGSFAGGGSTGGRVSGRLRQQLRRDDDFEFRVAAPPELPAEVEDGDAGAEQCRHLRPHAADGLVSGPGRARPTVLGSAPPKMSWSLDGVQPAQGATSSSACSSSGGRRSSASGLGIRGRDSPSGGLQLPPLPQLLQQLRASPSNVRADGQTASEPLIRLQQGRRSGGGAGANGSGGGAPPDCASGMGLQMGRRRSLCLGSGPLTTLPEVSTLEGEEPDTGGAAAARRRTGSTFAGAEAGLMVCGAVGDDTDPEHADDEPCWYDAAAASQGRAGGGPCSAGPAAGWHRDTAAWRLHDGSVGAGAGGGSGCSSAPSSGCSSGASTPHVHPLIPPPPHAGLLAHGPGSASSFASAGAGAGGRGGGGGSGHPSPQAGASGPRALGSAGSARSVGSNGGGGGGRYGGSAEVPAARAPAQPTRLSRVHLNRDMARPQARA